MIDAVLSKMVCTYEIPDDSGMLAIVDPLAYRSFVDPDWSFDDLRVRFLEETRARRMILWGTGREETWQVEVRTEPLRRGGFREFEAPIEATGGQLLLTNYESLTMAAQFADVVLPGAGNEGFTIAVQPGIYRCRVIQRFDPEGEEAGEGPDFQIVLTPGTADASPAVLPWSPFAEAPTEPARRATLWDRVRRWSGGRSS